MSNLGPNHILYNLQHKKWNSGHIVWHTPNPPPPPPPLNILYEYTEVSFDITPSYEYQHVTYEFSGDSYEDEDVV